MHRAGTRRTHLQKYTLPVLEILLLSIHAEESIFLCWANYIMRTERLLYLYRSHWCVTILSPTEARGGGGRQWEERDCQEEACIMLGDDW